PLSLFGGVLAVVYLLALGRFFLALGGLDTGSSFGGLGSSREMTISAIPELEVSGAVADAGICGALYCADCRDRMHPGGQPGDPPRIDHDPRSDGPRVFGTVSRFDRMGRFHQATGAHDPAGQYLLPVRIEFRLD